MNVGYRFSFYGPWFIIFIYSFRLCTDFHAGGKGPDPKQSRLDNELDAYMSSRVGSAAPETA